MISLSLTMRTGVPSGFSGKTGIQDGFNLPDRCVARPAIGEALAGRDPLLRKGADRLHRDGTVTLTKMEGHAYYFLKGG